MPLFLNPVISFKTESEVSHSVTTTTAYPETTYTSNTYHQTLLRGFDELRGDAHLCDVTLIAGTSKYPVHRSLLAACSPYFRQMFTKDAASSTICRSEGSKYTWFSESIELRGISSEGLRHIVEFIYTGRIPISMTTVQNILAVARHMQIQAVLDFCMEFLIRSVFRIPLLLPLREISRDIKYVMCKTIF